MVKIFRKVRQEEVTENRFGNYSLYAIGEIILVVIGILIALQIDNWNDERKDRSLENKIIKELISNLTLDLVEIRDDISNMDSVNNSCDFILNFFVTHEEPTEKFCHEVAKLKVNPHFDPNTSGYSLLQSNGVEIILNDSLRRAISVLYESNYPYYRRYETEHEQFKIQQINPGLLEYFNWFIRPDLKFLGILEISSSDFMKLKNDTSFIKLLHAIKFENSVVQNRAQRIERSIIDVSGMLKEELK